MKRYILCVFTGFVVGLFPVWGWVGEQFEIDGFWYEITEEGINNTVEIYGIPCSRFDENGRLFLPATVTYGTWRPNANYT